MTRPARKPAQTLDPTGALHGGLPTYPWRHAPEGLATVRQLRAAGLRPGGQEPAAQIRRGARLYGLLYRVDLAKPKRTASPAWLASTRAATRARMVCRGKCGRQLDYIPPKRTGYACLDCS